jgi:hypothetical protein
MIIDEMVRPLFGVALAVTWTEVLTPAPFDGEVMFTPAKHEVASKSKLATVRVFKNPHS